MNQRTEETLSYHIGQKVNNGGGEIVEPERADMPNTANQVWVYIYSRGFASRYDIHNVIFQPC